MWEKAQALSTQLKEMNETAKNKQYVLLSSGQQFAREVTLQLINNINNNKLNEWNEREEMIRHVYVVGPLTATDSVYRSGGFKCTCDDYQKGEERYVSSGAPKSPPHSKLFSSSPFAWPSCSILTASS